MTLEQRQRWMRTKNSGTAPVPRRRGPSGDLAAERFRPVMWTGEHSLTFEDGNRKRRRRLAAPLVVSTASAQVISDNQIHAHAEAYAEAAGTNESAKVLAIRQEWFEQLMSDIKTRAHGRRRKGPG